MRQVSSRDRRASLALGLIGAALAWLALGCATPVVPKPADVAPKRFDPGRPRATPTAACTLTCGKEVTPAAESDSDHVKECLVAGKTAEIHDCLWDRPFELSDIPPGPTGSLNLRNVHLTRSLEIHDVSLTSFELVGSNVDQGILIRQSDLPRGLRIGSKQEPTYAPLGKREAPHCGQYPEDVVPEGFSVTSRLEIKAVHAGFVSLAGLVVAGDVDMNHLEVVDTIATSSLLVRGKLTNRFLSATHLEMNGTHVVGTADLYQSHLSGTANFACARFDGGVNAGSLSAEGLVQLEWAHVGNAIPDDWRASIGPLNLADLRAGRLDLVGLHTDGWVGMARVRARTVVLRDASVAGITLEGADIGKIEMTGLDVHGPAAAEMPCNRGSREIWSFCAEGLAVGDIVDGDDVRDDVPRIVGQSRYSPDLYASVESALRNAGDIEAANRVFLDSRDRASDWPPVCLMGGYGRYPVWVYLAAAGAAVLLGTVVFYFRRPVRDGGGPTPPDEPGAPKAPAKEPAQPPMNPFLFSLDLFLPAFIELKYVDDHLADFRKHRPGRWAWFQRFYSFVHQLLGWVVVSLLILALSRYLN